MARCALTISGTEITPAGFPLFHQQIVMSVRWLRQAMTVRLRRSDRHSTKMSPRRSAVSEAGSAAAQSRDAASMGVFLG